MANIIFSLMHPTKMLVGMIVTTLVIFVFAYLSTEGRAIHNLKKRFPGSGIIFTLVGGSLLTYTLGSLLVFLLGILLPFSGKFDFFSLKLEKLSSKSKYLLFE